MSDARVGVLAAATAAVLFGSAIVATGFLLLSFTPVPGAFWRAAVGGVGLFTVVAVQRAAARGAIPAPTMARAGFGSRLARTAILGLLAGPLFLAGMNVAVAGLGATVSGFVVALYAVLAAVLAPFMLRERLEPAAVVGFVVAILGTLLLAELDLTNASAQSLGVGLAAAFSYALYLVLGRRWSGPYRLDPRYVALASAAATVAVLLVWVLATEPENLVPMSPRVDALLALAWLAFVLVGGQTLVMVSVRRIDARRSAAFLLLNPLTAALLAALLLREQATGLQLLGGGLVLVGMALASRIWGVLRPADSTSAATTGLR